jgi:hypothetical protein
MGVRLANMVEEAARHLEWALVLMTWTPLLACLIQGLEELSAMELNGAEEGEVGHALCRRTLW